MGLASRGLRDMDGGSEAIEDRDELATVRRQATRVHRRALVVALLLTALAAALR